MLTYIDGSALHKPECDCLQILRMLASVLIGTVLVRTVLVEATLVVAVQVTGILIASSLLTVSFLLVALADVRIVVAATIVRFKVVASYGGLANLWPLWLAGLVACIRIIRPVLVTASVTSSFTASLWHSVLSTSLRVCRRGYQCLGLGSLAYV